MRGVLSDSKQFYSTTELYEAGFSFYLIQKMVKTGQLVKLNKSMYENTGYKGDISDYSTVMTYIPNGVISMLSAASYYNLTTYIPDAIDIAIERKMRVSTLPSWPKTHIWYFPDKRYRTGVKEFCENNTIIKVYDIEKTVADILYYRNKVGIEETKEILTNYLKRQDRDLVLLHEYATILGCHKILTTYLEVLI